MYCAYELNKQGDNTQPWRTPFPVWNQSVVPCPVLMVASWPSYRFLKRQVKWSSIPMTFPGSWQTSGCDDMGHKPVRPVFIWTPGNEWKWKSLSCVWLCDPMDYTVHGILQTRILEWVAFPSTGNLPNPGIEPRSATLQVDSVPAKPQGKPKNTGVDSLSLLQGIFSTLEVNQGLLHCRQIVNQLSYEGRKWMDGSFLCVKFEQPKTPLCLDSVISANWSSLSYSVLPYGP